MLYKQYVSNQLAIETVKIYQWKEFVHDQNIMVRILSQNTRGLGNYVK